MTLSGRRALFMGRDGTLIADVGYARDPDAVCVLPGAADALRVLQENWALVVVSNQPGVGGGVIGESEHASVHERFVHEFLRAGVRFSGIYYCTHAPREKCLCRKPGPGMLQKAADELGIDLSRSVMIGDQALDVQAGYAAGCAFGVQIGGTSRCKVYCRDWEGVTAVLAAAQLDAAVSTEDEVIALWSPNIMRARYRIEPAARVPLLVEDAQGEVLWSRNWKTTLLDVLYNDAAGWFVDVGANRGETMFDVCLRNREARYLGFEPDLRSASRLQWLAESVSTRAKILNMALSDENGTTLLTTYLDDPLDLSSTIEKEFRPGRAAEQRLVAQFRFDDVRDDLGIDDIELIKIDVEGSELKVLRGMLGTLRDDRPLVLCEVLPADLAADMTQHEERIRGLNILLTELNYSIFLVHKDGTGLRLVPKTELCAARWNANSFQTCDFLFCPRERDEVSALGTEDG